MAIVTSSSPTSCVAASSAASEVYAMTTLSKASLNTGFGRCPTEAQVLLKAPMSVRMLGEMNNFFATIAAAVHKHNREADPEDFVGMGYPEFAERKTGLMRIGNSILLVGSWASLEALIDTERVKGLWFGGNRPLLDAYKSPEEGKGMSFVRSRHNERILPGEISRRIRRNERKGKDTTNLRLELALSLGDISEDELPDGFKSRNFTKESFFSIGKKRLAFRSQRLALNTNGEEYVSTYGFSNPEAPLSIALTPKSDYHHSLYK